MEEDLRQVSDHMLDFSISLLGHAMDHVLISGRGSAPFGEAFAIVHAAHGGELLMKAAIAKEHPLLIFDRTPRVRDYKEQKLSLGALIEDGRTLAYPELPDALWAATGFTLPDLDAYEKMGHLRNAIQHLAVPNLDFCAEVLRYLCRVADPVLRRFWGTQVFKEISNRWDEQDDYVFRENIIRDALEAANIEFEGWLPDAEGN